MSTKYVGPKDCNNLPFIPQEPYQVGRFAAVEPASEFGFSRIAPPQPGRWVFQPLYSPVFYRIVINTYKRTMFSALGISMPDSYSGLFQPQIKEVCSKFPDSWIDGFIRVIRASDKDMSWGQGSILINDIVDPDRPFGERQRRLGERVAELGICCKLPSHSVFRVPCFPEHAAVPLWAATMELRDRWLRTTGDYYQGIIAKKFDGAYTPKEPGFRTGSWVSYRYSYHTETVEPPVNPVTPAHSVAIV